MGLQTAIPMQISGHYSEIQVNFALPAYAATVNLLLLVFILVILLVFGTRLLLQRLKYSNKLNVLGITNNINKMFV